MESVLIKLNKDMGCFHPTERGRFHVSVSPSLHEEADHVREAAEFCDLSPDRHMVEADRYVLGVPRHIYDLGQKSTE